MAIVKRTDRNGKARYMVRVESTDPLTGKRRRVTAGTFGSKREAERAEAKAIADRERGTLLGPDRTTVGELLVDWLTSKRGEISANSFRDYEVIIRRHLTPALGEVRVQKLTAARLEAQYAAWADAGMSARLIRGCHMRLSQAMKRAVRFGLIGANPCDAVKPPKLGRPKASTWGPDEARVFLATAEAMPVLTRAGDTGRRRPDTLWPLWPLLLREGLRRGEALGLRWRDVNLDRGTAHIVQTVAPDKSAKGRAIIQERTKTNAGARTVRLTAATVAELREHRDRQTFARKAAGEAWQDHDLIITTATGGPINPGNVIRSFERIIAAATMPDGARLRRIRVHDLRHTAATLLLLAGTPAKVVSERLGHASISITLDLYSHVLPDMQDAAASAMDQILSGTPRSG